VVWVLYGSIASRQCPGIARPDDKDILGSNQHEYMPHSGAEWM
jgi:hypothetical protein